MACNRNPRVSVRALALALAGLLAAGCASTPPSVFYTLTPLPEAAGRSADISGGGLTVGLGPVVFPQFLDRPQIVTRDATNRLSLNEFQRWGGSIQDDFLRVWSENLAYLLGTSRLVVFPTESRMPVDFRILAEVLTFESRPNGDAVLKVRWSVMDPYLERPLLSREDIYVSPIVYAPAAPLTAATPPASAAADADYPAVVAAMSRSLGEFSRDVAAAVQALPVPQPPPPPPAPDLTVAPL